MWQYSGAGLALGNRVQWIILRSLSEPKISPKNLFLLAI